MSVNFFDDDDCDGQCEDEIKFWWINRDFFVQAFDKSVKFFPQT